MKNKKWLIFAPLVAIALAWTLALSGCGGSNPASPPGGSGGGGATAPSAPTGVTATAGNQQNTLSWTAVTGATFYNIYGGTASSSAVKGGTKIASASASPYSHSALTNGATYYYVVTAVNAAGESSASNLLNATPAAATPPAPPTGVTATASGASQINVNWTNVTGATGYNIYRSTTSPVASSAANKVNTAGPVAAGPFGNTGLVSGTTYYYVVTALNANGESALSQEASAATIPAAPTGLSATPTSSTQINLNWTAAAGAAGYNVYRSTAAGFTISATNKVGSSAGSTFNDAGLTANTAYYYKVTAVNAGGESAPSTEATATTPTPPPPPAPTGVTATASGTSQINVNWTNVTGATGYNIYRSTTSPVASSAANKVNTAGPVAAGPFGNTGLSPGTTYYYVVTALNANGESALSQEASAATIPAAPTGLSATAASSTQINLSWTAVSGAASYNVYRSTTAGFTISATNKVGSSAGTTFNDAGLTANTAYYYKVTAVNAGGESAPSTEAPATTPTPPPPPAPTGVTAMPGTSKNTITWTAVTGATSYNIYWSTATGVTKANGTKITGATSPYMHTGLTNGTIYYYVVTAVNSGGESIESIEANAKPRAGIDWTVRSFGLPYDLYDVYAGPIGLIAVGTNGIIRTSTDGIIWTPRSSNTTSWLHGVVSRIFVGGVTQAVAVGSGGTILTSPDGTTWSSQTSGTTNFLLGVACSYQKGLYVAVGAAGTILTSPDGITWTPRTSNTVQDIYDVDWNGTQFAAVGTGGTILTSPDGITWTSQTSGTSNWLHDVIWSRSPSGFVATGAGGTIQTSTNGIGWTTQTPPTTINLWGVAVEGSQQNGYQFVAVGDWGGTNILTSPDGITWTNRESGCGNSLYAVTWNNGLNFVAVGMGGTIVTSP